MDVIALKNRILSKLEAGVVAAMQLLMMVVVLVATFILYLLLLKDLFSQAARIESVDGLLPTLQQSFAGVLTVVLGLELLETLNTYFTEHHVRLEVILVVAIIAIGRQVIQTDFAHTPGTVLLGISGVIFALTVGYFLIKKAHVAVAPKEQGPSDERYKRTLRQIVDR
jgi:uncharacterized membrane protein (DUF373 family)